MDRFIREAECKKITGLSRTTRWRMIEAGTFPQRYQISPGISAWRLSEILAWMKDATTEIDPNTKVTLKA